jgi:RES domain
MKCCAECFGDRYLRREIIPDRSTGAGNCSYCETQTVPVVVPSDLDEYFELLVSSYRRDPNGKLLVHLFREDWGLFEHPKMTDAVAKSLLAEILDDGEIVRERFAPLIDSDTVNLGEWEKLRDELMYRNRFFPESNIDLRRLRALLSPLTLTAGEFPVSWYRARIQAGDEPFGLKDMGAPPKRVASHGRANPAGIPYLYLGSNQSTAVSEIRPHTGETVCVADFKIAGNLKLVDLRNPKKTVSPFQLVDGEDITRMRADLPYLERLGQELTRPVLPQAAAIDYTPSQYLCEFIKKSGSDGVIYRSSVGDGMNFALFNPDAAVIGKIEQYRVERVVVEVSIISKA